MTDTESHSSSDTMESVPCDLCGADDFDVYLPPRRMRPLADSDFTVLGEQGEHPQIVRCRHCGLIYANPRDTQASLVQKYQAMPIKEYLLEEQTRRMTARRDAARLARYVPDGRVLDVGCSAGLFLDAIGKAYDRYGVEPGAESARLAEELIGEGRIHNGPLESAELPERSFDAVTLWDVIEHMTSPRAALQRIAALLKDDGCLMLMTPDIGSGFARILGHRWPHLIRSHIYYFTRPTLRRMLESCGFRVVRWRTYWRQFTLRYLLERVGLLRPRLSDAAARPRGLMGITVPVNFFDACLVVARKSHT